MDDADELHYEEPDQATAVTQRSSVVYDEENDCPICREPFEGQPITVLLCGHRFCSECKDEWFKERENCPICRAGPDGNPQQPEEDFDYEGYLTDDDNDDDSYSGLTYGNDSFGDCRSCGYPGYNAPRWSFMRENLHQHESDEQVSDEPIAMPWYDTQLEWQMGHVTDGDNNDEAQYNHQEFNEDMDETSPDAGGAWFSMLMNGHLAQP